MGKLFGFIDGYELTAEQTKKGLDWLMDKWKSPTGVERKNNPFSEREYALLEKFKEIRLIDFYDSGNAYFKAYLPVYEVIGNDDSFEYHVDFSKAGKIAIIG